MLEFTCTQTLPFLGGRLSPHSSLGVTERGEVGLSGAVTGQYFPCWPVLSSGKRSVNVATLLSVPASSPVGTTLEPQLPPSRFVFMLAALYVNKKIHQIKLIPFLKFLGLLESFIQIETPHQALITWLVCFLPNNSSHASPTAFVDCHSSKAEQAWACL